jgi:hypothetical protein
VCFVAQVLDSEADVDKKGEDSILTVMPRRAAFLSDPTPTIVFHATPKHRSWMTHLDIRFLLLVRTRLRRGSFTSVADLETNVLAFIDSSNRTMARPFTWTSQGKALTISTTRGCEPQCTSSISQKPHPSLRTCEAAASSLSTRARAAKSLAGDDAPGASGSVVPHPVQDNPP